MEKEAGGEGFLVEVGPIGAGEGNIFLQRGEAGVGEAGLAEACDDFALETEREIEVGVFDDAGGAEKGAREVLEKGILPIEAL